MVAHECDRLAVGRIPRLSVKRRPGRDRLGIAPFDSDGIQVAEQVEDDGLAVGRNVERDPGSFVGRELDRPVRFERQRRRFFLGSSFFSLSFGSCFSFSFSLSLPFSCGGRGHRALGVTTRRASPPRSRKPGRSPVPRAATRKRSLHDCGTLLGLDDLEIWRDARSRDGRSSGQDQFSASMSCFTRLHLLFDNRSHDRTQTARQSS